MEENKVSSWKNIEQELIAPKKIKDFLLLCMSAKTQGLLYYSLILTHMVFGAADKLIGNNNQVLPTGGNHAVTKPERIKVSLRYS